MQPKKLTPMLWTDKLQETIDFYTQVLNFTCAEKNNEGWASLHNGEVNIMVARPNAHTNFEKPFFTGSFYFYVDKVDELWKSLKDKANVIYPLENFEWQMREFAIYDNNGYILQFGDTIK